MANSEKSEQTKKKSIIPILIGMGIMVGIIYSIGAQDVYSTLKKLSLTVFLIAFFLKLVSLVLKLQRFEVLLPELVRKAAWKTYIILLAVNQITPTGAGELASTYMAKNSYNVDPGKTLASLVIGRMLDTTLLFSMSILALAVLIPVESYYLSMAVPLIILVVGFFIILEPKKLEWFVEKLEKLNRKGNSGISKIVDKISLVLSTFNDAISKNINNRKMLSSAVFLTIFSWFFQGFSLFVLILGFGEDLPAIMVFQLMAIVAFSEIVGNFSFLPGGLGVKEASIAFFLDFIGIPMDVGLTVSLVWRFISYILLGGGSALVYSPLFKHDAPPKLDELKITEEKLP